MSKDNYKRGKMRDERLSINEFIWWALANITILTFAILSWAGCYYVFNFPEIPRNFSILEKIGRIGTIKAFTPLNAPGTKSATSEDLYELIYSLDDEKIHKFNQILKRGYITNYEKIPVYRYLQGEFRILDVRQLNTNDFIYPGLLIKARAYVKTDKNDLSSPYPLIIDYVLPTKIDGVEKNFQVGDLFEVEKSKHCASIINVMKEGRKEDPTLRVVAVPLAYNIYISPDKTKIPMSAPEGINVNASLPMF